jgi:hypothetical protein
VKKSRIVIGTERRIRCLLLSRSLCQYFSAAFGTGAASGTGSRIEPMSEALKKALWGDA